MLLLKAKILFDKLSNEISTKSIIRPGFNFGNNIIFSGSVIPLNAVEALAEGEWYEVEIEMNTIEKDAMKAVGHLVNIGGGFFIQIGVQRIGKGEIIDFLYYD
ncbi:hypothetical protein [Paenibacillus silagei]|uniref:PilZ domain-containing protein n=1 Tax=Paenibacillus silagei TaxID=1670801 RepID=A0ABS4NY17_9BACL|nr:hypothetical protein [Paenibacillus silagei]MBP2114932.1 hypothetical protein [Paenibacillus silagei]